MWKGFVVEGYLVDFRNDKGVSERKCVREV